MTDTSVEEQQLELEGKLYSFSNDQLTALAEHLETPVTKYHEKSRLIVIKAIREQIVQELSTIERASDRVTKLQELTSFVHDEPPPLEELEDANANAHEPPTTGKIDESNKQPVTAASSNKVDISKVFRRDFKIKGQIGSPGECVVVYKSSPTNRVRYDKRL